MYPGLLCTRPCRIISFLRLKPCPPTAREQPSTEQKCVRTELCTFLWELERRNR